VEYCPAAHAKNVHVIVFDALPELRNGRGSERREYRGTLLVQTDAPTPLPQIATPRSTFPATTA